MLTSSPSSALLCPLTSVAFLISSRTDAGSPQYRQGTHGKGPLQRAKSKKQTSHSYRKEIHQIWGANLGKIPRNTTQEAKSSKSLKGSSNPNSYKMFSMHQNWGTMHKASTWDMCNPYWLEPCLLHTSGRAPC